MNPKKPQQAGEDVLLHAAALRLLGQALALGLSQSAARIAQTLDQVGPRPRHHRRQRCQPEPARTREHAERARRYAQHERTEQHRWSHIAHNA